MLFVYKHIAFYIWGAVVLIGRTNHVSNQMENEKGEQSKIGWWIIFLLKEFKLRQIAVAGAANWYASGSFITKPRVLTSKLTFLLLYNKYHTSLYTYIVQLLEEKNESKIATYAEEERD